MGLGLLGLFGFKTEFEVNGVVQEVSNFADLDAINAIAQQSSKALDGLWFTYNIVPIIGIVIALIVWSFYKLNDKDVQIMADCNVGKISKDEADKLLSRKY
jgi:Na+/melibiose symporter-like transporter